MVAYHGACPEVYGLTRGLLDLPAPALLTGAPGFGPLRGRGAARLAGKAGTGRREGLRLRRWPSDGIGLSTSISCGTSGYNYNTREGVWLLRWPTPGFQLGVLEKATALRLQKARWGCVQRGRVAVAVARRRHIVTMRATCQPRQHGGAHALYVYIYIYIYMCK